MNEIVREILSEVEDKMKSTLSVFEDDLNGIRGNRASPALVDRLMVEYYGQDTELRQLANISTPEPMLLMIRPFDGSAVKAIEKAIQEARQHFDKHQPRPAMDALEISDMLKKYLIGETKTQFEQLQAQAVSDARNYDRAEEFSQHQ